MITTTKKKRNPLGQVKQTITETRKTKIHLSLQHMALLSQLIKEEYRNEMDVDFRDPVCNNLANRIINDCLEVQRRIKKNFSSTDDNFLEMYGEVMQRVFKFFIGMPPENITEFMDGCDSIQDVVTVQPDLTYMTLGLTDSEVTELSKIANRKGVSAELKSNIETAIKENTKPK